MSNNILAVVRQASLKEGGYFSATDKAAIGRCAGEIEAAK